MSFSRKLEVLSNIAILVVGIAVVIVLLGQRHQALQPRTASIPIGTLLPIEGIDKNVTYNLVMGLSTECHFCTESVPFYQRLITGIDPSKVHVIAAFPQSVSEAKGYLQSKALPVADVRQVNAKTLPIRGTPTLLILDSRGVVKAAWEGKLDPKGEAAISKMLM